MTNRDGRRIKKKRARDRFRALAIINVGGGKKVKINHQNESGF